MMASGNPDSQGRTSAQVFQGEAPESDEESRLVEEGEEATESMSSSTYDSRSYIPNRIKLLQMGQSMTNAVEKKLGHLTTMTSRSSTVVTEPTTPLSPSSEQMIQAAVIDQQNEPKHRSLLHQKLYERNLSLFNTIQDGVQENYTKVPEKMAELGQSLAATEATFQEAVMALQQANHHCSETFWTMDDSVSIAKTINFPTT